MLDAQCCFRLGVAAFLRYRKPPAASGIMAHLQEKSPNETAFCRCGIRHFANTMNMHT